MPQPIFTRGPAVTDSLINKWSDQAPQLSGLLDQNELQTLIGIDQDRVNKGQYPLSNKDTALAILAMKRKNAINPPPSPTWGGGFVPGPIAHLLGNAVSDIGDIGAGIIHLPGQLVHEAGAALNPAEYAKAQNIAQLPVVRMLPGSFTLNALLSGEPGQLAEHPVMTALDVLPYANKLSELALDKPLLQAAKDVSHATAGEAIKNITGKYPFQPGDVGEPSWWEQVGAGKRPRGVMRLAAKWDRELGKQFTERFDQRINTMFEGMDRQQIEILTRIGTERPDLIPNLPFGQQQVVGQVRGLFDELANEFYTQGKLFPINGEWYDIPTAKRMLEKVQRISDEGFAGTNKINEQYGKLTTASRIVEAQDAVEGRFNPDLHRMADDLVDNMDTPAMRDAIFHMFEKAGFVDADLVDAFHRARYGGKDAAVKAELRDNLRVDLHRAIDAPPQNSLSGWDNPAAGLDELTSYVDDLRSRTPVNVTRSLTRAHNALISGEPSKAVNSLRAASRNMPEELADDAMILNDEAYSIERMGREERLPAAADRARVNVRKLTADIQNREAERTRTLEQLPKIERRKMPQRFGPMIQEAAGQKLKTLAITRGANPDEVEYLVAQRLYDQIPEISLKDRRRTLVETRKTWVDLKNAGMDPVFLHSVSPEQIGGAYHAHILTDVIRTPTAVRTATLNAKPAVRNFAISLKHEAVELLRNQASMDFQDAIRDTYGKTLAELQQEYTPAAMKMAAARGADVLPIRDQMINKDFQRWNPESIFPWPQGRSTPLATGEEMYLPHPIARVLATVYRDKRFPALQGAWDAATDAFRFSVLAMSPRWHVYNVLGGALMTMGEVGPINTLKFMRDAWKMARRGELPMEISSGLISIPEDAMYGYLGGKTAGRLIQSTMGERGLGLMESVGKPLSKVAKASYKMNEVVDNFYRSIAYLYGQGKKSHEYGVELANKVLQDWDSMLPIERTITRSIFPFYGWMRHILSYTFRYPFDHPWRASIISNFARNEMEDWGTGLPQIYSQYFQLGKPNAKGEVKAINMRGANPFADVANYFTLAGFMSQMNPAIGAVMESAGLSGITGRPELYPDLQYDPKTGQLTPQTPSIASGILQGFVPQTQLLSIIGLGPDDMKTLAATNKPVFNQRLWSAAGFPFYPKTMKPLEKRAFEELKRSDTQQAALNKALRTGDWSDAWTYPNLRPILKKYQELLDSGALQNTGFLQPGTLQQQGA